MRKCAPLITLYQKHPQICVSPHEYSWEDLYFELSYVIDISDHNINTEYAELEEEVACSCTQTVAPQPPIDL